MNNTQITEIRNTFNSRVNHKSIFKNSTSRILNGKRRFRTI